MAGKWRKRRQHKKQLGPYLHSLNSVHSHTSHTAWTTHQVPDAKMIPSDSNNSPVAGKLKVPLIAYRSWKLNSENGKLCPVTMHMGHTWTKGVNEARCVAYDGIMQKYMHTAPSTNCQCGLYGLFDPQKMWDYSGTIGGAIAVWGDIELYATGVRAQYAQIVALYLPVYKLGFDGSLDARQAQQLADDYECELICETPHRDLSYALLRSEALKHGQEPSEKLLADINFPEGYHPRRNIYSPESASNGYVFSNTTNFNHVRSAHEVLQRRRVATAWTYYRQQFASAIPVVKTVKVTAAQNEYRDPRYSQNNARLHSSYHG